MPNDANGIGVLYSVDGKNWNQADFPLVEQYERIQFNPTSIKNEDGLWIMLDQYEGLYYSTLIRQISKSVKIEQQKWLQQVLVATFIHVNKKLVSICLASG